MFYFLIGFMGSGKSTLGQYLAKQNNWHFIDLDDYLEAMTGRSIAELFAQKGEAFFREKEAEALRLITKDIFSPTHTLIACGGGTPLFFDNHSFMKSLGKTIYLKVPPQILAQRLQKEKDKRPILKEIPAHKLLDFIQYKVAEREPEYEKADMIWDFSVFSL